MGYTTEFDGQFELNKPLSPLMKEYLNKFNDSRRMKRSVEGYGTEGEFFVNGVGFKGQGRDETVIDNNEPPVTQPGLWCQWKPNEDGTAIEWDGAEKFYYYSEWLVYIIHKFLAPNGYILEGIVTWQGEDTGDVGEIIVKDNRVFLRPWRGVETEVELMLDVYVGIGNGDNGGFYKRTPMDLTHVVLEENLPELLGLPETLPEEMTEEEREKKILEAKVEALKKIADVAMNPSIVKKILEEVEEKFK
jgi:hypothetical protein